jgi:hypothetical protein
MPTTDGTWRAGACRDAVRRWPVAPVLAVSCFAFLALALLLAARRAMGALVEPLPAGPLLATATICLVWTRSVRAIGQRLAEDGRSISPAVDRFVFTWTPLVSMLLVAVACSYPGHRELDWAVWLPALVAALFPSRGGAARTVESPRDSDVGMTGPRGGPAKEHADWLPSTSRDASAATGDETPGQLLQQLTRVRLAEGREAVHGVLLAEFTAGQQIATLYVGFCPPFEHLPHVDAEVADGPAAKIKIVQVLHNGARLDVVLGKPAAEAALVSVEFMAAERGEEQGTSDEHTA